LAELEGPRVAEPRDVAALKLEVRALVAPRGAGPLDVAVLKLGVRPLVVPRADLA